jgi:hypothetical protein
MEKLRWWVPVSVIAVVVLLLMAPMTALAAPNAQGPRGGCGQWPGPGCGDNSGWYPASIPGWQPAPNGGWYPAPNDGWYPAPNDGWRPAPGGGWKGDQRGGWNGDHNNGWDGGRHGGFTYTVRRGDTLSAIGWRYGSSALELARVNHIRNPNLIYPGQRLWIP